MENIDKLRDKEWLYNEYHLKDKSSIQIAKEIGCTDVTVLNWMNKHNIPGKNHSITEETIKKVYKLCMEGYNLKEISEMINEDYQRIRNLVYKKTDLKSNYKPGEETKKEEIRKKISATLQGITIEEWENFVEHKNSLIRKSKEYIEWRALVFKRDSWACQNPNCKFCGNITAITKLNAHHIKSFAKYNELRFDIDNGITYCEEFHLKSGLHKENCILPNADMLQSDFAKFISEKNK